MLLYYRNKLLLHQPAEETYHIPQYSQLQKAGHELTETLLLGTLEGRPMHVALHPTALEASHDLSPQDLRPLLRHMPADRFHAAGHASHWAHWHSTSQFCGRCGTPTQWLPQENGKECPNCGFRHYPRVVPAVIVAVNRGRELLLGANARFQSLFWSVLAGFVDPGESLEQTIHREIREEASITIKNIKYFGSQPWPFPNSLMLGFTAEYESGTIKPDGKEIINLDWFKPEELPTIPPRLSIARALIDNHVEQYGLK